jgi:hypothetical protein
MIVKMYGRYFVPVCDNCEAQLDREESFEDAVQAAKDAGWKAKKVGKQWKDYCTECQEG